MNPYKAVRKTFRTIGHALLWLLCAGVFALFTVALWGKFGAWALTWPIVLTLGFAIFMGAVGLLSWPVEVFKKWWLRREREWGTL